MARSAVRGRCTVHRRLPRPDIEPGWSHLLPLDVGSALVASDVKSKPGPLAFSTVSHRLAVLVMQHQITGWDTRSDAQEVKILLREARKAQRVEGLR